MRLLFRLVRIIQCLCVLLIMSAAQAQTSADFKACGDQKGEPALQACTRVIDSKDAKVKMEAERKLREAEEKISRLSAGS